MRIESRNVEFAYKNRKVLRGLDFSADSGDVVAILGPNGVGKSTLFRCLLGYLHPHKGSVHIDGKDIRTMSAIEMAKHIAYIPQAVSPTFNYTVLDTALMGATNRLGPFQSPRASDVERALEVLDSLGISHLTSRGCDRISGGERQLALLARALVQDAGILIMDEPTANLDYGNNWRVMERIVSLASTGYTVIFSTHDPNQALFHANQVLAMKEGVVVAAGVPGLTLTGDLLSRLYNIDAFVHEIAFGENKTMVALPKIRNSEFGIRNN